MNNTRLKSSFLLTFFVTLFLASCDTNDPRRIDFSDVPEPFSTTDPVSVDTTESGLIIYVIEEGEGEFEVGPRDEIEFYYTKRYKSNLDRIISSSYANGVTEPRQELVTTNGSRFDVIVEAQFREGLIGMKEGEKRVLILTPPIIGYLGRSFTYTSDTVWVDIELENITF
ncbi:hypothetical protein [Gracilimonas sp.]|uniref:hypothetical protein n=1 Tax=Gracilimonas sp. TaxID=1974203 RepID=UPI0032EB6E52